MASMEMSRKYISFGGSKDETRELCDHRIFELNRTGEKCEGVGSAGPKRGVAHLVGCWTVDPVTSHQPQGRYRWLIVSLFNQL
jgi:hypothetical protein